MTRFHANATFRRIPEAEQHVLGNTCHCACHVFLFFALLIFASIQLMKKSELAKEKAALRKHEKADHSVHWLIFAPK
jgi:hypothetical protein